MKTKISLILMSLVLVISMATTGQEINRKDKKYFKVVGYYFLRLALTDTVQNDSNYAFLDKVTHVNIAFINPDTSGNFTQDFEINSFIKRAHNKNVKVLPSIAGGGPHTYYAALLQNDKRRMLINNLLSLVLKCDFDGVDVDLEGNDIDSNYEVFVTELAAALKPLGKLMTAAIATVYKDKLSDKALQQFDFVNIMSYDQTGPWNPRKPGHHSPYKMAEEDLEYWNKTRLIPKEKLVLGVPFYGYGFGSPETAAISMNYKEIVSAYPDLTSQDTIILPDQKVLYYNGTSTIKKKTELAIQKAGGIMIWQILGDAPGENSLLQLINNVIYKKTSKF